MHYRWIMALGMIAGASHAALACSCLSTTRDAVIREADVVFTGTVESVTRDASGLVVMLDVSDVAKGTVDEQAEIHTAGNSAACGVTFTEKQTVEIAARQREGVLHTDLCTQLGLKQAGR